VTELLYQTDSYIRHFEATVIGQDADSHAVILDRTAFYPGGGGQPPDRGTLTAGDVVYTVREARKIGGEVVHILEGGALPAVGQQVVGHLDWERRYQLMRTHTALHILCGVIWRDHGALATGSNMEPLLGRIDFEFETMQQELVREIEEAINAEVEKGREVRVRFLPREEAFQIPGLIRTKVNLLPEGIREVRVVEIVGLDMQADGGTHVRNTSEVGCLRIVDYKSKGRINKRIYVEVGA